MGDSSRQGLLNSQVHPLLQAMSKYKFACSGLISSEKWKHEETRPALWDGNPARGGQPRNAGWQEAAREAQLRKQRMASCKGQAPEKMMASCKGPPAEEIRMESYKARAADETHHITRCNGHAAGTPLDGQLQGASNAAEKRID